MFIKVAGAHRGWSGPTASPTPRWVGRTLAEICNPGCADVGIGTVGTRTQNLRDRRSRLRIRKSSPRL